MHAMQYLQQLLKAYKKLQELLESQISHVLKIDEPIKN